MIKVTLKHMIGVLISILSLHSNAQDVEEAVSDSLLEKEYKILSDLYYEKLDKGNNQEALIYAKAYFIKGKAETDSVRIARAFKYFAFASTDTLAYQYADSIIHYTRNSTHKYYPTQGYIIKGTRLYNWGEYDKSLDNFLMAYTYAKKKNTTEDLMEIRYAIGAIKNSWGSYEEALAIFKENLAAIQQQENYRIEYKEDYLTALHSVYSCYISNKKIDSAKIYIRKGLSESLVLQDSIWYYSFVLGSGIADYFDKNYLPALDSINKATPHILNKTSLAITHTYKGKSLYELQQKDSAIIYFKKADSIYYTTQDEFPELHEVYQTLVDYYKEKNAIKSQLLYIDKLLHVDSILLHNYKDVNKKIVQKYDTPYLIAQKEALITTLHKEKSRLGRNSVVTIVISVLIIGIILIYNHRKRQVYKKKFELLLQEKDQETTTQTAAANRERLIKDSGLSGDIAQSIMEKLDAFETTHGYTDNKITLYSLAKQLETNSAYLSKVVNAYKNKNFAAYLNELRVDYAIEKLKTDAMFRRYVVKTIAYEVGFNSPESFSKTFYRKTGIYPSYFIKQLNNQEKTILI